MSTDSGQACTAIILAAGQGTRMKSGSLPKAMFTLAGRPLIHYPVSAALEAGASEVVVVVGHGRELVERYLAKTFGQSVKTAVQEHQLGTGDAAKAGMKAVSKTAQRVIVFVGDVPLITAADLKPVIQRLDESPKPAMAPATRMCCTDAPFRRPEPPRCRRRPSPCA